MILILVALTLPADALGFRWGAAVDEILEVNGEPLAQQRAQLSFASEYAGLSATAVFFFADDALASGLIQFTAQYDDNQLHMADLAQITSALTDEFGEPDTDVARFAQPMWSENEDSWGNAVAIGQATFTRTWMTQTTEIVLSMTGERYDVRARLFLYPLSLSDE